MEFEDKAKAKEVRFRRAGVPEATAAWGQQCLVLGLHVVGAGGSLHTLGAGQPESSAAERAAFWHCRRPACLAPCAAPPRRWWRC